MQRETFIKYDILSQLKYKTNYYQSGPIFYKINPLLRIYCVTRLVDFLVIERTRIY